MTSVAALQPMIVAHRARSCGSLKLASTCRRPILCCAGLPTPVGGHRRLVTRGDDKLLADGLDELDVLGRGCLGRICQGGGELCNRIFNLLDRGLLGRPPPSLPLPSSQPPPRQTAFVLASAAAASAAAASSSRRCVASACFAVAVTSPGVPPPSAPADRNSSRKTAYRLRRVGLPSLWLALQP